MYMIFTGEYNFKMEIVRIIVRDVTLSYLHLYL